MSRKIVFMGTPDFSVPILHRLVDEGYEVVHVITQPDRPKGRKRVLSPPPVKIAAQQLGIPVFQPERLADPEAVDFFMQLVPDLVVTAAYGQLLPKSVLDVPKFGCINVHASLLPKYRGGAPIHWALINGEQQTGVTIMYMVPALDAGDMLAVRAIDINATDHVGTLHDRLSQVGADLVCEVIPSIFAGTATATPQNETAATYAANIQRQDERIDWTNSAKQVFNQVRGLHPWPVAVTTYQGKPLKIWWTELLEADGTAAPGTVTDVSKDGICVATGQGTVRITELQPAGKKRMSAHDFICGIKITAGDRLGD